MKPYQTRETWRITKPVVRGSRGLVSTQHYLASEAGARVLRDGGNAVDAAVAAGLALGVVEPWMSGIGGGGFMQYYDAATGRVQGIDFAMASPAGLDPADYPLATGTNSGDKFNWPSVLDDRHTTGPYSIAVPGYLCGVQCALETFGTRSFSELIQPALELARFGLPLDWTATLKITNSARDLRKYEASRGMYLPDGLPPVGPVSGEVSGLPWGNLVGTYERLASAGPSDFYGGELAVALDQDAREIGSSVRASDLSAYGAETFDGVPIKYRDATIWAPQGMNAGPSLARALQLVSERFDPEPGATPSAKTYGAYADVLLEVYADRLAMMGVGSGSGNTSHLGVVDAAGNIVTWTQTVMSAFGSKVVAPRTGITMNNGIMWFDPIPDRPNSIRPGVRPLSNMCPTIVERADGFRFAI
ncbi:MAG: gamma-glutamyltranspeptidase/glutathione hydrolase, partial [Gammaproteobacteria bacterium]